VGEQRRLLAASDAAGDRTTHMRTMTWYRAIIGKTVR
jgi:hypothetical protein